NLAAATAAIQAALQRGAPVSSTRQDETEVIDVEAWEIPEPRTDTAAAEASTPTDLPPTTGDVFMSGCFRSSRGQRDYQLYVPPHAGDRPMPLVVMLHGCTQDADDFAAGTAMNEAAREQGFYVLYPIQPRQSNPQKCWNWFKHNHQQQGRGEPEILAGMTRA